MLTFLDGPAHGTTLLVRRAPLLLRAVQSHNGKWDALDQLDDFPLPQERVIVYRLVGEASWAHFRMAQRSRSGFYAAADYRVFAIQPSEEVLRNGELWRAWTGQADVKQALTEIRSKETAP